jgi:hypothetical protein
MKHCSRNPEISSLAILISIDNVYDFDKWYGAIIYIASR